MRDGDRAVIIRPVANLRVGDRVRGLTAVDTAGWVRLTKVEKHEREYDTCYLLEPALDMYHYLDEDEWVVVLDLHDEAEEAEAVADRDG